MCHSSLKVCHMTSTHHAKDQRIFEKECVSLAQAGFKVYLLAQGKNEKINDIFIIGTGEQNSKRFYRLLIRPWKIYKKAVEVNADIYHFHDMELLPYGLKLKAKGKKVIFDYHEDYASRFADSDAIIAPYFIKKLFSNLYRIYEKYAIKKLDGIISVTPHICKRLKKINKNTIMITNYPLLRKEDWAKNTSYNPQSDYICFAGQISDTYKLEYITKIIQDFSYLKFKLCGPPRKKYDIEKIKKADKNCKIEYMGNIPYNEVPEILQNALALPIIVDYGNNIGGKTGTLGNNKLFEAMLCGIPIICTNLILWEKIINKYHCGICVDPTSPEELKHAIQYILDNPDQAKKMGDCGRQAVLKKFNWNIQEKFLIDMYKGLL